MIRRWQWRRWRRRCERAIVRRAYTLQDAWTERDELVEEIIILAALRDMDGMRGDPEDELRWRLAPLPGEAT
jgi:hypothetical protein